MNRRPPMVFSYCRVSHVDSAESGFGIADQMATFERAWKYWQEDGKFSPDTIRAPMGWQGGWSPRSADGRKIRTVVGEPRTDGFYIDLAKSAYGKPFRSRPAGGELDKALVSGDTVAFPRMDRGFRNVADFSIMAERWLKRGITIVFIKPFLDMNDATGRMMAQMLCVLGEWESAMKSERTKAALMQARWKGLPTNAHKARVYGFKMEYGHPIPYWEERAVLHRHLVKPRARCGFTEVAEAIERDMALLEKRSARPLRTKAVKFTKADGLRHGRKEVEVSDYVPERLKAWLAEYLAHTPYPLFQE